jgi:hypothetical protein
MDIDSDGSINDEKTSDVSEARSESLAEALFAKNLRLVVDD